MITQNYNGWQDSVRRLMRRKLQVATAQRSEFAARNGKIAENAAERVPTALSECWTDARGAFRVLYQLERQERRTLRGFAGAKPFTGGSL